MSLRILMAMIVVSLSRPCGVAGQASGSPAAAAFRPTVASAALGRVGGPVVTGHPTHPAAVAGLQDSDQERNMPFVLEAVTLSAASLGGLWLGALPPFPPADDDSDLSVWHLATAPAGSIIAVSGASLLLGHDMSSSLGASLIGSAAGAVAGLLASMVMDTAGVTVTYAGVHGLVATLLAGRGS